MNCLFTLSILVFSNTRWLLNYEELSNIAGILDGPLSKASKSDTLSWSSHNSKRAVKSINAAEILTISEDIDSGKITKCALSCLLGLSSPLTVSHYSHDLLNSLTTFCIAVDKSIRADVRCIRYEYEMRHADQIVWTHGKVNLLDPRTNLDSPLAQTIVHTMASGRIGIDFLVSDS